MSEYIYQIYDKIFKKVLTLSSKSVINMINGLFDTDYSEDSKISYNWTEFEDDKLRKTLADTILTINDRNSYHLEAQMTEDEGIIFRVFDYGYSHANRQRSVNDNVYCLPFPEPIIIYLDDAGNTPDMIQMEIDFGTQGTFRYKVPTVKYLELSMEELNRKKLVILIPFQLLRVRKLMEKARTEENLELLKNIIQNDILGSIRRNLEIGNITQDDVRRLQRLTGKLYDNLYSNYDEMEEMNEMTDESLLLDIDIIEMEHAKKIEEVTKEVTKEVTEKVRKQTKEILKLSNEKLTCEEIASKLRITVEEVEKTLTD
ncbi:MAG: hypothetical protein PHE02_02165 [Lachnospiraceae bacterium]|nr:hypothetical protein [Lachnospiraceae bacterium]